MKIAFLTLGCKVNSYETEKMKMQFETEGHQIVSFSEKADVYVVNTCTVTNIADRKSRKMLHRARRMNPDAVVAAAGCYVDSARRQRKYGLTCRETSRGKRCFPDRKMSGTFDGRNVRKGRAGAAYKSIY